jgi:hypothetical protein
MFPFYVAIKKSLYRPAQILSVQDLEAPQIYRKSAQESGKVFSCTFLYYASITIHVEVDPISRILNPPKMRFVAEVSGKKTAFFFKVEVIITWTSSTLKSVATYSSKQR